MTNYQFTNYSSWVIRIQQLIQNGIVVEVSELAVSNKKSAIHVLHVYDDPSLIEITKLMLLDLDSSFEIDCACCVDEAFKKTGNWKERESEPSDNKKSASKQLGKA